MRGIARRTAATLGLLAICFGGASAQTGSADLHVDLGVVCDPTCGPHLGLRVGNFGPDTATNVVVELVLPERVFLDRVDVFGQHRVTSPGIGGSGLVRIEIDELAADKSLPIDVTFELPDEDGWEGVVPFTVTSATPDPQDFNNTLDAKLSVPHDPVVTEIRALANPFRLEITGRYLALGSFGGALVGECREIAVEREETQDGTLLVLTGGRDLRKLFPKGEAVTITLLNIEGGTLTFTYTR